MKSFKEDVQYKKALEYIKKEKFEEAIEQYQILIKNTSLQKKKYLIELAKLYQNLGNNGNNNNGNSNNDKILQCYFDIISFDPNDGFILNEIGILYFNAKKYKEALLYFYKILKIKELPDVYNNIGTCYVNMKNYNLAELTFLKSYNINQNDGSKRSLGSIYYYIKQYDKSLLYYNQIPNKSPSDLYNMSFTYLSKKQFKKGFELYENRLISNNIEPQTGLKERVDIPQIPYWNGKDHCNRLLIVYEQGIGDNIQYFRFIIQLSKENPTMKIDYFCKTIISHIFDIDKYENVSIVDNVVFNNYDFKIYIMSLPSILRLNSIQPNNEQYIKMNNNLLLSWKEQMQHLKKFRVGFVYNGLLKSFVDKYIPIKEFIQLCDLDIDLICIHKKQDIDDPLYTDINTDTNTKNTDINTNIKNTKNTISNLHFFDIDNDVPFEDTIHILHNIDLLITIDTYIAHLAGVMNINTWLLLGYSEWRWSNHETETYWYNSVKLVRKTEETEFKDLIIKVKEQLKVLLIS